MKYPNAIRKKEVNINLNRSTSNRGMDLEFDINRSNQYYLANEIAVVHKKPTPIQVVKVDYPKRSSAKIVEAYYKIPSTTDYNGLFKNHYIDFEAKECNSKTSFPFTSLHHHQLEHLALVDKMGGYAFLIIRFNKHDKTFLIMAKDVIDIYLTNKRKSLSYDWVLKHGYLIETSYLAPCDYLKTLAKILEV